MGDVIKGEMMLSLYNPHKCYYAAFSLIKDLNSMFQVVCDIWCGDYLDFMLRGLRTFVKNWKFKGWDMVSLASFDICHIGVLNKGWRIC
jgi:hypothetical protein